jgi:DNA-binding transcriptional ArsR family regulator
MFEDGQCNNRVRGYGGGNTDDRELCAAGHTGFENPRYQGHFPCDVRHVHFRFPALVYLRGLHQKYSRMGCQRDYFFIVTDDPDFEISTAIIVTPQRLDATEQLGRADASITELAERFHMTLTGMKKHVGVLEQAGLVTTHKVGRVRTCKLGLRRLEEEAAWIERYRRLCDARFDELDQVVEELQRKEKVDGRRKRA